MQVSNIASYVGFSKNNSNYVGKNNHSLGQNILSFGKKGESSVDDASDGVKKKKGHVLQKSLLALVGAFTMSAGGVQIYNSGASAVAQYRLSEAFKQNPKNVALQFIDFIAPGGKDDDSLHLEYGGNSSLNPFEIKNPENSFLGANSVVSLDFDDGAFSSASLDIDGDKYPEIIVGLNDDGTLEISYDYDSDGEIDTVETLKTDKK